MTVDWKRAAEMPLKWAKEYATGSPPGIVLYALGAEYGYVRGVRTLKDKGITLQKIYARDNGICWLCGGKCEWSGDRYDPKYPTMDHVIPLTKRGTHTWSNIRLAHRQCNCSKNNRIIKTNREVFNIA